MSMRTTLLLIAALAAACGDNAQDTTTTTGALPQPGAAGFEDAQPAPICDGVDCSSLNTACEVGVCDPATGACVAAPQLDGVPCVDGDACTTADTCQGGACVGAPVVCFGTPCRPAACDPNTGACAVTDLGDGASCDDGSVCTTGDTCTDGICSGAVLDCSSADGPCARGACDPIDGCYAEPFDDGTACADAVACEIPNTCLGGECQRAPLTCEELASTCQLAVCDGDTGGCAITPVGAGAACDDGDPCTAADKCDGAGGCSGFAILCGTLEPCKVAACIGGGCSVSDVADGVGCDDGNPCTVGDVCSAGICGGGPLDCASLAGPCRTGVCDGAGGCAFTDANEGDSCDDDPTDCQVGTCSGGSCEVVAATECSTCGNGEQVCGGGVCGSSLPEWRTDFEDGVVPAPLVTGGGAPWTASLAAAVSGGWSARAGQIGNGAASDLSLTRSLSGVFGSAVTFFVHVQADAGDALVFLVDNVEVERWTGATPWIAYSYPSPFGPPLAAGVHTFTWRYQKDATGAAFADTAFLDDIRLTGVATPIDFEDGTLGPLTPVGQPGWQVVTGSAAFGSRAARIAGIPNGTFGALRMPLTLSRGGQVHFFYRRDAAAGDGLVALLDGTQVFSDTSSTGWVEATVFPNASNDVLELRYQKNATGVAGQDALWIDQISASVFPCF